MTTDHLTPAQRAPDTGCSSAVQQLGLGMAVPGEGRRRAHVPGGFGWDGGTGTTWRSDPARDLTGILFTQRAMTSPQPPAVFDDFWACAYGSLT